MLTTCANVPLRHVALLALAFLARHPPAAYAQTADFTECPPLPRGVGATLTEHLPAPQTTCETLSSGTKRYRSKPPATAANQAAGKQFALFSLPANSPQVLTLSATSSQDFFSVAVFDQAGKPLLATYSPASEQQLQLTGVASAGTPHFVEVTFENAPPTETASPAAGAQSATPRPRGEFVLTVAPSADPPPQSMAYRRVIDGKKYAELLTFARCDTAGPEACPANTASTTGGNKASTAGTNEPIERFFEDLTPGDTHSDEEPIVAFVGLGGSNRIVLVNKRGNGYTPRHVTALPARPEVKWLWVLYLEDDESPFETSIDVLFKPRAAKVDFEEFDPANLVNQVSLTADTARGAGATRVIRVGLRRVRVRQPPVAIEVAYSRLGVGYGLRQWRRVYRLRSWSRVAIGAGLFVPFTDVKVETHRLIEPGLPDGQIPNYTVITPYLHERPIFAMASLYVPKWRDYRDEATGRLGRFGWTLAPEIVVGMGLPPKRDAQAYYLGLGWNVAVDRIGFTAGLLLSQESHLLDPYRAGWRFEDEQKFNPPTFAEKSYVAKFTVGMTVNLLGLGREF